MKRYDCLKSLFSRMPDDVIVVGNVGDTTTAMLTLRPSEANLYSINLGSCTAVGLGLALGLPHRRVVVLDGDGNLLLNLAALADVANQAPKNLSIVVQDNEVYQSGGNVPSATAGLADVAGIAKEAGIRDSRTVREIQEFEAVVNDILTAPGPVVIVAKIEREAERPQSPVAFNPVENKFKFVRYIEKTEGIGIIAKTRGSSVLVSKG
jgi:thiamine pyrophosphate-dependent acetolactate synthase large subunit-like protein